MRHERSRSYLVALVILFISGSGLPWPSGAALALGADGSDTGNPSTPFSGVVGSPAQEEPLPIGGQGGHWSLRFRDEFSGSTLDTSKWNACRGLGCPSVGPDNRELQCYSADNVFIGDGFASLKAERRTTTCAIAGRIVLRHFTSGMITTGGKFGFLYGYMEARTRGTSGRGLWPALWALPSNMQGPPEIDQLEILGDRPATLHMTYHFGNSQKRSESGQAWIGPDFSADWHVFGVYWSPESIRWYVDGIERREAFTTSGRIVNVPMSFLANLAVGGAWPGAPDASTVFPNYFDIDYVRIWQR